MDLSKNQYFISDFPKTDQNIFNGLIARKHVETILQANAWRMVQFPVSKNEKLISKVQRLVQSIRFALFIPKKSRVIFFHPIYPTYSKTILFILNKRKSIDKILLIHDIESVRNQDRILEKKETIVFKKFSFFIVHNNKMKEYFGEKYPNANIVSLDFFDFLSNSIITERTLKKEVTFAGNIQKSPFVKELKNIDDVSFFLYGSNEEIVFGNNTKNMGKFDATHLPMNILGSFGLVWDGLSIAELSGSYGTYLKLNTPHKASFYIVYHLPLIVHTDAAIADLVSSLDIGWTISSLKQLPNLINAISDKDYKRKLENIKKYAEKISHGFNLLEALSKFKF